MISCEATFQKLLIEINGLAFQEPRCSQQDMQGASEGPRSYSHIYIYICILEWHVYIYIYMLHMCIYMY